MLRRSSDSQWWPRVSVGTKILPRLLGTFRAEWPGIRIGLRESRDSAELIHAVETGDIDVTFIDIGPYETGPLEVRTATPDADGSSTTASARHPSRRTTSSVPTTTQPSRA